MAGKSLFEQYRTPLFTPSVSDSEYDSAIKAIKDNRKDIEKELMAYALAALSRAPNLASLVPYLSKATGIIPSSSLDGTVSLIEDQFRNLINENKIQRTTLPISLH